MFIRNPNIDPIVSEGNPAREDFVYFILESGAGYCTLSSFPWSTTLHVAINPRTSEYYDAITCNGFQVYQLIIDSIDLPESYLSNLVRLSRDKAFLAIQEESIYMDPSLDCFDQVIEYYIRGHHQRLWCYHMRVIDGEPIRLKPQEGGGLPIPFEIGITGTKELMNPSIEHYIKTRK